MCVESILFSGNRRRVGPLRYLTTPESSTALHQIHILDIFALNLFRYCHSVLKIVYILTWLLFRDIRTVSIVVMVYKNECINILCKNLYFLVQCKCFKSVGSALSALSWKIACIWLRCKWTVSIATLLQLNWKDEEPPIIFDVSWGSGDSENKWLYLMLGVCWLTNIPLWSDPYP